MVQSMDLDQSQRGPSSVNMAWRRTAIESVKFIRYLKKQKIDSSHENTYINRIREDLRASFSIYLLSRNFHDLDSSKIKSLNLFMRLHEETGIYKRQYPWRQR